MILDVPADIARFAILRQIAKSVFAEEPYRIDDFIYVDEKLSLDVKFKDEGVEISMFDEGLRGTIPVKSDSPSRLWSLTPDGLSSSDLSKIASIVSTFYSDSLPVSVQNVSCTSLGQRLLCDPPHWSCELTSC